MLLWVMLDQKMHLIFFVSLLLLFWVFVSSIFLQRGFWRFSGFCRTLLHSCFFQKCFVGFLVF